MNCDHQWINRADGPTDLWRECYLCGTQEDRRAPVSGPRILATKGEVIPTPRDLLESLVDDGECRFDHSGGCQQHGYLDLGPGDLCPQAELKAILGTTTTEDR